MFIIRALLAPFRSVGAFLINAAVFLVPILGTAAVSGNTLRFLRDVWRDPDARIQTPQPFDILRGLGLFVIQVVYVLPIVVLFVPLVATVGINALFNNASEAAESLGASVFALLCVSLCCLVLYLPVLIFVYPLSLISFALQERLSAAFSPRAWKAIVSGATGAYILRVLVVQALTVVVSQVVFSPAADSFFQALQGVLTTQLDFAVVLRALLLLMASSLAQTAIMFANAYLYGSLGHRQGAAQAASADISTSRLSGA